MKNAYGNMIKNFIINKPACYLPEKVFFVYIIFVSRLLWIFNITYFLKYTKVTSIRNPNYSIYQISGLPMTIRIQSQYRITRFLKGFEHAGKRQWERYGIDLLIKEKLPETFIDVGANIGEVSYYAYTQGVKNIYAIEPDPVINEILRFNLRATNVIFDDRALGLETGTVDFYIKSHTADSSLYQNNKETEKIKIECTTLDSFFAEFELDSNVLLKMDAEGFEAEILSKGGQALNKIKYIAIDGGPERGNETTSHACIAILKSFNFEILLLEGDIIIGIKK